MERQVQAGGRQPPTAGSQGGHLVVSETTCAAKEGVERGVHAQGPGVSSIHVPLQVWG